MVINYLQELASLTDQPDLLNLAFNMARHEGGEQNLH